MLRGGRLFSALAILLLCGFPAAAQTEEDFELSQNRSGGVTITGYRGTEKTVVIPGRIGELPVTIIGNKAFYRKELEAVTIPESVETIEPLAFAENRLNAAVIPGGVYIGYEAFAGNLLESLVLSRSLSSIGQRAFMNNRLENITLPGQITNIGKDAFAGNPLSSITLGANRNIFASQGFEPSFINYYIAMGRKAGIYVKEGRVWSLREEPPLGEGSGEPLDRQGEPGVSSRVKALRLQFENSPGYGKVHRQGGPVHQGGDNRGRHERRVEPEFFCRQGKQAAYGFGYYDCRHKA